MIFASPNSLWLLLLVPALAGFLWWSWCAKQRLIALFVHARLMEFLTVGVSHAREWTRLALVVAAVGSLVLALARPMWGFTWEEVKQRGLDIVVAIDTSRSMLAEDVRPNRIARAKLAALDVMKMAKNDRLGLVAFAGSAFLQCPLTLDDAAFRQCVEALNVSIIPQGGSALTSAIETALTAFKDDSDNHKILVLFTDGEDHDGGALEAAKEANKKGLRIFTIGIGSTDGELVRVAVEKGRTDFLRDDSGNIVKSRLNESLLQQIAGAADGFYLNLRGVNTIETLYEKGLAPLPKADFDAKLLRRHHERFYWPLGLGIVLLLLEMFLPDRPTTKRSARESAPASAPPRRAAAVAVAFLAATVAAQADAPGARRDYEAGRYEAALKEYQRLRERRPADARLHFNAGASAYQARRYDEAARALFGAIASPGKSLQQSGFYNLGNTFYRAGEPLDTDKKIEAWETAVQLFEQALKMDAKDKDAEFNRDFVKKKLEELKQQQQQQQKQNQQQQDQQRDKKDSEQKSDPQKQDKPPPQPGKQDEQKDGPKDQQPGQDDQKQEPKQDKGGEQQKQEPREGEGEQRPANAQPRDGQMTPQQAQQLLDSQKGEERALIFLPPDAKGKPRPRFFKDW
jgi:Ca-activated chloride channel family protein